jgi:hypothetical protein
MQPYIVGLPEAPEGIFFTLKDTTYSPEVPRLEEPFIIKGKITLFGIPFLLPLWVMATVTYPETWWEEIIPIIGAPRVREVIMVTGGDFEITFPKGFLREGEYELVIYTYLGPTVALDSVILPPAPSIASYKGLFTVSGAPPSVEETFQEFEILGYSKGAETMVAPNNPLELNAGDTCRVHIGFSHKGVALNKEFYAGLWQATLLDPHNMMAVAKKTFNIPMSADWEPYQNYIDIPTTDLDPGDYGLYAKENKLLPKLQVFLPEGVIKIAGIAPTEWILVQEVSGITVAPEAVAPPAEWILVQEVSGITIAPEAVAPPAGWILVQEVSGITIAPEAVAPGAYTLSVSVATPAVGWVGVSPSKAQYNAGETVTLTAYLDNWAIGYYAFDHWTVNGVTKVGNPINIVMNENKVVVAYFVSLG